MPLLIKTYYAYKPWIENCLDGLSGLKRKKEKLRITRELSYAVKHTAFTGVEFFMLGLHKKTHEEWFDYLPDKASWTIYYRLNNAHHPFASRDKYAVYQKYQKFFNRDVRKVNSNDDKEKFLSLLERNRQIMVKPQFGSLGEGIRIIKSNKVVDKDKLFSDLLQEFPDGIVAEELIEQENSLKMLNPTSVNTLRITTVRMDDETYAQSFLRIGKMFSSVDNIATGGIVCALDQATGVILRAMDKLGKSYITHPDTGMPLIGYTVPRFSEAVALAKEMAQVAPDYRYMGWDIALTDDGWILVEQNAKAGIYCIQQTLGRGVRKDFEQFFSEVGQPTDFPDLFDEKFISGIKK